MRRLPVRSGVRPCSLPGVRERAVEDLEDVDGDDRDADAAERARGSSAAGAARAARGLKPASASTSTSTIPSWMIPPIAVDQLVEDVRVGLALGRPARDRRPRSSGRRARASREPRRSRPYDVPAPCPIACSLPPRLTAPSPRCARSPSGSSPLRDAHARARADAARARDGDRRQRRRVRGRRPERGAGRARRAAPRRRSRASSGSRSSASQVKDLDTGLLDFPALRDGEEVRALLARRRGGGRVLARHRRGLRRAGNRSTGTNRCWRCPTSGSTLLVAGVGDRRWRRCSRSSSTGASAGTTCAPDSVTRYRVLRRTICRRDRLRRRACRRCS